MGDKMEERVVSIETQIALMQKDINNLRDRSTEFPQWLKRSAISVLGILFLQLTSTIWWAAELTTKQSQMQKKYMPKCGGQDRCFPYLRGRGFDSVFYALRARNIRAQHHPRSSYDH